MTISTASRPVTTLPISVEPISPEAFVPFGQVVVPCDNNTPFNAGDAELELDAGTPRLYIMHLEANGMMFDRISRHSQCTQCLGSLRGATWWIAVAPPNLDSTEPDRDALRAFEIPGDCFINLARGTWHAGPHFETGSIDFYNLELDDTNTNDFFTHVFASRDRCQFEIMR